MGASTQITSKKSVNKAQGIFFDYTYTDTTTKLGSDVFQIPNECTAVNLQVGAQATAQTIAIQGSNDGVNFATIAGATKASASGVTGVAVFARNTGTGMIGYFPYYRLYNDTGTANVSASLSFTLA